MENITLEKNTTKNLLNALIQKGGIYGACAKMIINDEEKAHQFILECSEQCHSNIAEQSWGKEIVSKIIDYKNKV